MSGYSRLRGGLATWWSRRDLNPLPESLSGGRAAPTANPTRNTKGQHPLRTSVDVGLYFHKHTTYISKLSLNQEKDRYILIDID